ncbi:DUF3558 family protein [Nocardia sp. alder85J]|uniref:DUF3558 family protein n=1 Tax=Nocardia sp. alder85J TaxID=2862949 RepID=UPI001CD7AEDA|nr:DUF3558 family protein [Nocardia sp. alder85J]MCX4097340.1 DUF3558 family protein [Nocardia sp. alder85J]
MRTAILVRTAIRAGLAATILAATLAGCSGSHSDHPAPSAADPNLLAGCGPLADQVIAGQLHVAQVRPQTQPTICTWTADLPGGGTIDLTYAWLREDTLQQDLQVAAQFGYRIEKLVLKKFGGMYWRDPNDPGSCAVTTADTGTVTWWVQNRDHAAQPDPCAAAMGLMQATLSVDGV